MIDLKESGLSLHWFFFLWQTVKKKDQCKQIFIASNLDSMPTLNLQKGPFLGLCWKRDGILADLFLLLDHRLS